MQYNAVSCRTLDGVFITVVRRIRGFKCSGHSLASLASWIL